MNWKLPPHLSLKKLNPFKPRSEHGGMNNGGIVVTDTTVIKSVPAVLKDGFYQNSEADLAWQIATQWPETLQKYVPHIKSIWMDIEENKKFEAERYIQIEMSRAEGKPLSRYLHDRKIYHAMYAEVLKVMKEIEAEFLECRFGDRHSDNIFVKLNQEGGIDRITLIDLDPTYFRDVNQSIEQHIARYQKNRLKRMVIQWLKKCFNY